MAESLLTRLRRFREQNTQVLLDNPETSFSFLSGQGSAISNLGAGFLAPAVDRARQQERDIARRRQAEESFLSREMLLQNQAKIDLEAQKATQADRLNQLKIQEAELSLTPEARAAAEQERSAELRLLEAQRLRALSAASFDAALAKKAGSQLEDRRIEIAERISGLRSQRQALEQADERSFLERISGITTQERAGDIKDRDILLQEIDDEIEVLNVELNNLIE